MSPKVTLEMSMLLTLTMALTDILAVIYYNWCLLVLNPFWPQQNTFR